MVGLWVVFKFATGGSPSQIERWRVPSIGNGQKGGLAFRSFTASKHFVLHLPPCTAVGMSGLRIAGTRQCAP